MHHRRAQAREAKARKLINAEKALVEWEQAVVCGRMALTAAKEAEANAAGGSSSRSAAGGSSAKEVAHLQPGRRPR